MSHKCSYVVVLPKTNNTSHITLDSNAIASRLAYAKMLEYQDNPIHALSMVQA